MKNKKIMTFTGRVVSPLDMQPGDFCLEDIAHSLALKCRFGGHVPTHYSVAQHSLIMAWYAADKKWAALHDAAEVYLCDAPSPIKDDLIGFRGMEERILRALAVRYDLVWPIPDEIKILDRRMLATEGRDFKWRLSETELGEPFEGTIKPWTWEESEKRYLQVLRYLFKDWKGEL